MIFRTATYYMLWELNLLTAMGGVGRSSPAIVTQSLVRKNCRSALGQDYGRRIILFSSPPTSSLPVSSFNPKPRAKSEAGLSAEGTIVGERCPFLWNGLNRKDEDPLDLTRAGAKKGRGLPVQTEFFEPSLCRSRYPSRRGVEDR